MTLTGSQSDHEVNIEALSRGDIGGKIGNVLLSATGKDAELNTDLSAEKSIGTLTLNATGYNSFTDAQVDLSKAATLGKATLNADGTSAFAGIRVGGDLGSDVSDIAVNLKSGDALEAEVTLTLAGVNSVGQQAANLATVGNTVITAANNAYNDITLNYNLAIGSIGNITGNLTGGDQGDIDVTAAATAAANGAGGTIGNVTLTNSSEEGNIGVSLTASNTIGNVAINATGAQSTFGLEINAATDTVGDITIVTSTDVTGNADFFQIGTLEMTTAADVGTIKVTGGSNTSEVELGDNNAITANTIEKIDFSGFNGFVRMDLSGVLSGTEIIAAKNGSDIEGTAGADTIRTSVQADVLTGGLGADKFVFGKIAAGFVQDTINDFTTGSDKLVFTKAGLTNFTADIGLIGGNTIVHIVGKVGSNFSGNTRFIFDAATEKLSYDADGSGTASTAIDIAILGGVTATTFAVSDIEIVA